MKPTWVVVADAAHARVYLVDAEDHHWVLEQEFENPTAQLHNRQLEGNHPNQLESSDERTVIARGAESRHDEEMGKFAIFLADFLHRSNSQNRFEALVLVAAPRFLGALRSHLKAPVVARVSATFNKDYVGRKAQDLQELVGPTVAPQ